MKIPFYSEFKDFKTGHSGKNLKTKFLEFSTFKSHKLLGIAELSIGLHTFHFFPQENTQAVYEPYIGIWEDWYDGPIWMISLRPILLYTYMPWTNTLSAKMLKKLNHFIGKSWNQNYAPTIPDQIKSFWNNFQSEFQNKIAADYLDKI